MVNPSTLLAALNKYGKLQLAIEPAGGLQTGEILTLNLGEIYQALNKDTLISDSAPWIFALVSQIGHIQWLHRMAVSFTTAAWLLAGQNSFSE